MINKKSLCVVQQKKIGLFTFIIVLSALFSVIVKGTLVANKILQQNQIMDKKSNIGQKRTEMVKIQKAVKYINDANYNKNLKRKSGFYSSFDKQEFIDSVITKMNHEDDFDLLEEENKSKLNLEYSGFMIRINPTSNTDMERHLAKLKSKMIVVFPHILGFQNLVSVYHVLERECDVFPVRELNGFERTFPTVPDGIRAERTVFRRLKGNVRVQPEM